MSGRNELLRFAAVPGERAAARNRLMEIVAPTPADAWDATTGAVRGWVDRRAAEGVALGLNDPVTGWPTPDGYRRAGEEVAMALIGGTVASRPVPARLAEYAEKLGYSVSRDVSKVSGSEYLNLTHGKLPDQNLKVRISNHDLPPSYGTPGDFDVHVGQPRDLSVDWTQVVRSLAGRVGKPVPGPVAAVISRQESKAAAQSAADVALRMRSPAYQESILQQAYPKEWDAAVALSGAERSIARRTIAGEYEAANPGVFTWAPYLAPKP